MIEIRGTYNTAKVFSSDLESQTLAKAQIQHILNQPFVEGSTIRIMPDVQGGMACPTGWTMTLTDKVVPNFVGVDIGCGMLTAIIKDKRIDLNLLDKVIHQHIPTGFGTRSVVHHFSEEINLSKLRCVKHVSIDKATHSIGTLGGGNHFIELGQDDENQLYLIVHSGSRNLGKQVCEYYQNRAADVLGRTKEGDDRALAYLEGDLMLDYLYDMVWVQYYADLNRNAILNVLEKFVRFKVKDSFHTRHNYIDCETMILRKGAVRAHLGDLILIPINMRDGSLLCHGKGNKDWNYSAPHGAGRVMSRKEAKEQITLTEYKEAMKGIHSTTISRDTIDEAPQAYKPMDAIIENSRDTITVLKRIKPLYNFIGLFISLLL